MSQPAAIRAAFAEWRMVKSRKVLQLVFEVPLETQGEVLTMLGPPMPDVETWCGIARLEQSSQRQPMSQFGEIKATAERPGVENGHSPTARARASELGQARYREATPMGQALTRASILAKDERFQAWAYEQTHGAAEFGLATLAEEGAADYIRETCCNGATRVLIAEDPEAYRKFLALETMFKIAVGEIAEPR